VWCESQGLYIKCGSKQSIGCGGSYGYCEAWAIGHVERKSNDDLVSNCRDFEVVGVKGRGRSRTSLGECVRQDLRSLGLKKEWAEDRAEWRCLIWGNRPTRACMEKRT